jgi:predicted ribosomally synthesized peptide with SipW-like signal peptide
VSALFALLLGATATHAAWSAAERAQVYARLPNWTGQWEIVGITSDASGGLVESPQEVLQAMRQWGPPPVRPEFQGAFNNAVAQVQRFSEATARVGPGPAPNLQPMCAFGFPNLMIQSPLMFEILITPEETAMIFSGREMRHIYTDGRPHTPKDDLWPTRWGDSIGHWEGQTLVIDTIAVSEGPDSTRSGAIFAWGGPANSVAALVAIFSLDAHYVERIRMLDKNHLEEQMTISDPMFFTGPWTISRKYQRVARIHRMVHEDCAGEDRNPIVNGEFTLAPPPR